MKPTELEAIKNITTAIGAARAEQERRWHIENM